MSLDLQLNQVFAQFEEKAFLELYDFCNLRTGRKIKTLFSLLFLYKIFVSAHFNVCRRDIYLRE